MKKNSIYQFFNSKGLLLIILIAFVIRMGFFVSLQPWNKEVVDKTIITSNASDASGYHKLALSLMSKKSFEDFDAFRTPGYPVFVALIYSISSGSVCFVLFMQILLSLICVVLVYNIAATIFHRKIALISAFLFAIDMHQAYWAVTLYTDTLFVFLFLVSVYCLCKSIKENNFSTFCLSALFLGIATLVRPISFLFPFVAVIFILVFCNLKLKMKLVYSLLFSIIYITTISPWLLHNYLKYREVKLSSISGYNLLFYNAAYTEVHRTGKTIEQVWQDFNDLAIKQGIDTANINSFKNSQIYSNIAKQYIKNNFILYCKMHFRGIVNMYANLETHHLASIFHLKSKPTVDLYGGPGIFTQIIDFFQSKSKAEILIAFGVVFYLLINYLFSLYGIIILIGEKEKFVFLFILIILYFSVITGVVGLARYKIPFMPFINILCAVGLFHFYVKIVDKLVKVKK
jgi:4-amino-4-deoxy-L-arabinose transferase-like glycosyltransferase